MKTRNSSVLLLCFVLLSVLYSCDNIDKPLKDNEGNTCGDENLPVPIRKILVEDYTGQKCNNCPVAAETLHEIKDDYCDHVIPIAIHIGSFASPSGTTFPNDFRTEAGEELDAFYGIENIGLPQGLVNRTAFEENVVLNKDNWRAAVHELFLLPPDADIQLIAHIDTVEHKISASVNVSILNNLNYELNLGAYLAEDSIVSAQLTHTTIDKNYTHRHMLRAAPLGTFGQAIANSAKQGDVLQKTLTFDADTVWNPKHCELILFLSNSATGEIIQAESEKLLIK